jgi:hypothetical protein
MLFNLRRDSFDKSQHNRNTCNDALLGRPIAVVPI